MNIKSIFLSTLFLISGILCTVAQTVINPGIKSKTTFAIVVDSESYAQAKNAVDAYKKSIEADGLGTYMLIHTWKSPEEIRELLIKLHADPKAPLEGCVLVGDIPIPMLRDAQHLSSAFKMDQRRDWKRSSIPSDRYYDDFGLEFKFLKQDSIVPAYFYFSLKPESKQYLSPSIYSARIRPLELEGKDKYQMLRDYLMKVVAEKQNNAENPIDNLTMARGHGYNSEDEVAWAGEQLALKEQFPELFKPGNCVKFMDFESRYPMKNYYLNEVQRPDLDIMLFHHHGADDTQYINGYPSTSSPQGSIENIKLYLRGKISSQAPKRGKEATIESYMKSLGVPREWCEEAFDAKKLEADSLFNLTLDIYTNDIHGITPNARFVMFDACYNGSFYEKDNIAGAYIFNKGKTIVTQGNTVNTIQDKWPDEFLGLLNAGLRIGEWHRHVCFLETHLIGDPTFRFANRAGVNFNINEAIVLNEGNVSFWKKMLKHPLPDMQAMALRQLSVADAPGLSAILRDAYFQSPYGVVRLEAMRLLAMNCHPDAPEVLNAAVNDSYELVRRFATEYIAKHGSDELLPAFAKALTLRVTDRRMFFKFSEALKTTNLEVLEAEIKKQAAAMPLYDDSDIQRIYKQIANQKKSEIANAQAILDTTTEKKDKRQEILSFRNHPATKSIDTLLKFIDDPTRDIDLRVAAAETLGWYNMNYNKQAIIQNLSQLNPSEQILKDEITKTINRLKGKNR